MDGRGKLLDVAKARVVQRLALEDAEPDLDLIEPTRAGGCEVEGDVRMGGQPVVVLLVRVQVVSRMTWIWRSAGCSATISSMKAWKSVRFLVCVVLPRMTPVATSSAANRLMVPWRL